MKSADEVYGEFRRRYPDIFLRRRKVRDWVNEKKEDAEVALEVWKLLDMFEDCDHWENNSIPCDSEACIREEEEEKTEDG